METSDVDEGIYGGSGDESIISKKLKGNRMHKVGCPYWVAFIKVKLGVDSLPVHIFYIIISQKLH